ncbi:MAG: hypothetical protein U1D30_06860 [Planctomycetota bacterium]
MFSLDVSAKHRRGTIVFALEISLQWLACLLATTLTIHLLYSTTQEQFRWGIDERLLDLASVAALEFDAARLDQIGGPESIGTEEYETTVLRLRAIRHAIPSVRYAYILRPTRDPLTFEFVADADSLDPAVPVDLNGDGNIDDGDALVWPGDPYDVEPFPEFREAAFVEPFVDPELTHDQWGTFLSGTAPIRDKTRPFEPARYVLGLDMEVTEFETRTQRAFLPFLLFAAFVILNVTGLTIGLTAIWRRQFLQLVELDRQKDELIGVVGHQLHGPVSTLRLCLEELLNGAYGPVKDSLREPLTQLLHFAENLSELTTLLLDVSRIELGKLGVGLKETDLEPFLAGIVERKRPRRQNRRSAIPCRFATPSIACRPRSKVDACPR